MLLLIIQKSFTLLFPFKDIHAQKHTHTKFRLRWLQLGAYLWWGLTKIVCVCVWWHGIPSLQWINSRTHLHSNHGLIRHTEGQMSDLQEFQMSASLIFQPPPLVPRGARGLHTHDAQICARETFSLSRKCRSATEKWQSMCIDSWKRELTRLPWTCPPRDSGAAGSSGEDSPAPEWP